MRLELLNEQHLQVHITEERDPLTLEQQIRTQLGAACYDIVVAYDKLLIHINSLHADIFEVQEQLLAMPVTPQDARQDCSSLIEIPVCYDPDLACDLLDVASHTQISVDELISIHSEREYKVLAMGFSPGFAYLGDLNPRLSISRLDNPRTKVPAGSVAIAADQTAVYPIDSPGGWRIIGRTPLSLLNYEQDPITLFSLASRVKFNPISRAAFDAYEGLST